MSVPERPRCAWPKSDLSIAYHDREWGVPVRDDRRHFEFIVLDGAQAGLSWETILRKREAYREAYEGFDPERVARFDRRRVERLLKNEGIVRNRAKIEGSVRNARAFLELQREFGTFDAWVWRFTGGSTRQHSRRTHRSIPSRSRESDAMSDALRERGFSFAGSTICYAYMQAAGMVNDHLVACYRWEELGGGGGAAVSPRSRARR